ncbi:hypothetical protein HMPREF0973_00893 [Prevotella veroralis F0319]|uniref:AdoMet activation domain-containing protein n=1 Tax=Prevotella veroralis F0319 TaxID=649761 RepID=C9MMR0_9BACT|nr:hypothetical protein HMPREF0973_00893 [Prevotella veroralis F0319]
MKASSLLCLGKIDEEQQRDYAHWRGLPMEKVRIFLSANLLKT